ncbi:MAG: TIGR00341 family protein [Methyloprofundus sp.]|nr:TIGR00341 family protein [Methyloprofundus sp.]
MTAYVQTALFVYTDTTQCLMTELCDNEFATKITPLALDKLLQKPQRHLKNVKHVVIAGSLTDIKLILNFALDYNFSVGLIPDKTEKILIKSFGLAIENKAAIDLALQTDAQAIDLILCNEKLLLFKASIGSLPLLGATGDITKFKFLMTSIRKSLQLKLLKFCFSTAKGQKVITAASGCLIIQQHKGSLVSTLIENDNSFRDGSISMLVYSPTSIIVYGKILLRLLYNTDSTAHLPQGIGFIRSSQIKIETSEPLKVTIDDSCETQTPLDCRVLPKAVHVNIGTGIVQENSHSQSFKESVKIAYRPNEKEVEQVSRQHIPFFSHASEERFRELFISLRDDAKVNSIYITLMVLSTLLATIGLFQGSSAVVIGAMLLAPLMAPIVSLAMGLLRGNLELLKNSILKILLGIVLALLASALITQLFPHKMLTSEMTARLSPTLLDLAVAIVSGIAGAYSKSFKEIIQSLAGVAIAVALVPPLAVAGIGIGRGNLDFFLHAFLLFSTNLIGITLAATFTFRILGFSPIVYAKRGIGIVFVIFLAISVPLYASYERIVETIAFESLLEKTRFLVNGKYIIVNNARLTYSANTRIISAEILTRDDIDRKDLMALKNKIKLHFKVNNKLVIKTRVLYIL